MTINSQLFEKLGVKHGVKCFSSFLSCTKMINHNKKLKFSRNEDLKLIELVGIYGNDWFTISKKMDNRNVRQCRERWRYYLDPSLKQLPWTDKDDELLLQKVDEVGNKWKELTAYFPNRTYISLKNRYATLKRRLSKHPQSDQPQNYDEKILKQTDQKIINENRPSEDFESEFSSLFNFLDDTYYEFLFY